MDASENGTHLENERLEALLAYDLLDTSPEQAFDDIARIAAQICDTPIALISLVDDRRQWFKANIGLDVSETSRELAFCAHAIEQRDVFEVRDTTSDERFADNPLVTGDTNLRFYAGAPLETAEGHALGTLCVLDHLPRALTDLQRDALAALARQVMNQIELRRHLAVRREAEQRHRFILESATDYAIVSMKLDGTVTSWNEGAARIMGWTEKEMCGNACDDFFTPEDRAADVPAKEMGNALAKGRGWDERWHLRKDGSRFWANGEMMPLIDDGNQAIGFIKILRDRTEQHLETVRLQGVEDRFQTALDAAGFIGSWDWDVQANRIIANERLCRVFSVDPALGAAGLPLERFTDAIHPDDRVRVEAAIKHCVAQTGQFAEEYRLLNMSGDTRWVRATGRCFHDVRGRPTQFPGVVIDINDRKLAEEHRALLTGELQHRIKNTLSVVQAIVSQSLRSAATPMEARDTIGNRLAVLSQTHDLLTRSSWSDAPISSIVNGTIELLGGRSDRIRVSGPDVRLNARAALALSLALHELGTNAVKYGALSADDGQIDIRWSLGGSDGRGDFLFVWTERGGPEVSAPGEAGFGTRLMKGLSRDLGGAGMTEYLPDGVVWTLQSNVSALAGG